MEEQKRVCRRCLLADMQDQRPLRELVYDYIASIPADKRADDGCFARRLALCRECGSLLNGTCAKCGCYAEARAAKKAQHCPDVPPKW